MSAVDRLRGLLEFRRGDGQSYLVARSPTRWQLYVPTMLTSRRPEPVGGGPFLWRTIEAAWDEGLVDVGHDIGTAAWPEMLAKMIGAYEKVSGPVEVRRIALAPTKGPAVVALAVLQTGGARLLDSGTSYDVHLVRSIAKGTPGPMLCGYERFTPDAPGWGFGGVSGPAVTQIPCPGCVDAALRRYPDLLPRDRSPQSAAIRAALDTRKVAS